MFEIGGEKDSESPVIIEEAGRVSNLSSVSNENSLALSPSISNEFPNYEEKTESAKEEPLLTSEEKEKIKKML